MNDDGQTMIAVESLRGQLRRLDTVLKMTVAEQRRVNAELTEKINLQAARGEAFDARLDRLDNRLATYSGGLLAIWLLIQAADKLLR
ncbi:hypothetical protein Deba_3277 [Desulfarculus baarsii DSM 2075]|uniref:Uncharacterized protein n=1 Tax=Desulfarculus baarsii (strain ATCC 33931 / DSM 2075 / LMG 7858 / VKM B-1802 / 2st14) TaxID=644282 RepID=E1QM45_DESB2|nr:hypothetical protein [Desulfarculus baarsii]ADK86630.1 hypothetical protein Deba_3277 [Desulfarculus baarsii DSM 2075]